MTSNIQEQLNLEQANINVNSSNIIVNTTNIADNANNIATNVTNIANNTGNIASNLTNINNNTTNINNNEVDILELQLKTQYQTVALNQTNFHGMISLTGGANWIVSHNALRINTIGLYGIVLNPGASSVIDLHSNTVTVG